MTLIFFPRDYAAFLYYDNPMREHYTLTRLYIDAPLHEGSEIDVPKDQIHYLMNVLRMGAGDSVRLFNARDGEWRAEIANMSKRQVRLEVKEQLRSPQTVPDIWLCFAPVKKHRNAFILEKATELGAARLQPITTQRTQFGKLNLSKMSAQIIEAAEQTERLCLPELKETITLDALLQTWDPARTLIMADEGGDCPPALGVLKSLTGPAALIIGPEGGFTPQEREFLRSQSFVKPVSLGPRILRADTAALSLLTLWQAAQGDWL